MKTFENLFKKTFFYDIICLGEKMKLLDLLFKTDEKAKEILTDDIIKNETKKIEPKIDRPIEREKITRLGYNNINVYSPKTQEEIEKIVLNLIKNEASIVSFRGITNSEQIRILDFLSGSTFALNGEIHRLTEDLFLITPENLRIKVLK